ncbi:MAG TPA: site-2 protease family protein [Thermoanaerobaculia bacterium]|jgi:hypothetical protein|nr:site-2 protease family protein [Thermoanaerobaculia bacterium]
MRTRCTVTALLAVAAVYLAVWPHEIGHATAAWLYGCKADAWRTGTHWYLAGSQGGAIDEECLARRGGGAVAVVAFAGIVVNLLLAGLAALAVRWWLPARKAGHLRWGLVATLLVALANGAEALSYLVLNTLWLKADMRIVVAASGVSRWIWPAAGLFLGVLIARALAGPVRRASGALAGPGISARLWMWAFAAYALAVGLAAMLSRILLSAS